MRIRGVDIPEALLAAQRSSCMVVFAGAGVSRGAPSNYPDFPGLAKRIAEGTEGVPSEPLDRFLGELESSGVRVHERAIEHLTHPTSRPTALHENLLKLFGAVDKLRLVTTNFDTHFSTAAEALFHTQTETYYAPALPLGHDFKGIVYLHGCVSKGPKWLVLTDRDFGRAYLTEGWATRFLQAMFSAYSVLFAGYSHNDPVMNYLARGLPPQTPRFALVPEGETAHWRFLGVEPVTYGPAAHDPHAILYQAVERWAELAAEGILDFEQRIRALVELPPPLDPEDKSYLEWAISDPMGMRFFTRHARSPEYLVWLEKRKAFQSLFQAGDVDEIGQQVAYWLGEHFVGQHDNDALALIERQGQWLNPYLWRVITQQLAYGEPAPAAKTMARWVPVLLGCLPPGASDALNELLRRCLEAGEEAAALLLFDLLTQPYLRLKKGFSLEEDGTMPEKTEAEVELQGDQDWLTEVWNQNLRPKLDAFTSKLWPVLLRQLQTMHRLLLAAGQASDEWDPISYGRSAIEPHEQDEFRGEADVLIDAARDVLEWMVAHKPDQALAWIEALVESDIPLLKRLALHGMAKNPSLDADAKIGWLLKLGWLYAPGLKHEVFQLLKVTYPNATQQAREDLLREAERPRQGRNSVEDDDIWDYERYNLLYWLHGVDPQCSLAASRFASLQESHPQFKPRKYPDLVSWSEEWVGPSSPISIDELLAKNLPDVVDYLLTFKGESFMGPDRPGLLDTVRRAVAQSFDWGWRLAGELQRRCEWISDLWEGIIRGWRDGKLTEGEWRAALQFLIDHLSQLHAVARLIADLLKTAVEKEEGALPSTVLPLAECLAETLWAIVEAECPVSTVETEDWLTTALNHPGGDLTWFWLQVLSKTYRENREDWQGLPERFKRCLFPILSSDSAAGQLGRVLMASQIKFLFALDEDWTHQHIIPLLDWDEDPKRAQQAWYGFLPWGRWTEALLLELMPLYEKSFAYLATQLERWRDRFSEHLALIALDGGGNPLEESWLTRFLQTVSLEDRRNWARHVSSQLNRMREEAKEHLWKRWLERYWRERTQGIPAPLDASETKVMAEWVLHLRSVFPAAVDWLCNSPPPRLEHTSLFRRLSKGGYVKEFPGASARLLLHLLSSPGGVPNYHCTELEKLTEQLIDAGAPSEISRQLCEKLAEIGCPRAAELARRIRN